MGAADELAELSADIALILEEVGPDRCTIETPALVDDGHGGKRQEWAAVSDELTELPCIAYPNAAQAKILGEVPASKTIYSVLVKGGAAVTSKMRVRIDARGTEPERIVEVKSVLPALGVIVEIVGLVQI